MAFDSLRKNARSAVGELQQTINNPKSSYREVTRAQAILAVVLTLLTLLGCDALIRGDESVAGQWYVADPLLPN